MIELAEVVSRVDGFDAMPPRERIQIFAWYLHTQRSMEFFDKEAIKNCYNQLHLIVPDLSVYLPRCPSSTETSVCPFLFLRGASAGLPCPRRASRS
jgi:hypothetical protein